MAPTEPPPVPQTRPAPAPRQRFVRRLAGLLALAVTAALLPGCAVLGFGAQVFKDETPDRVEAQYTDLADQDVAVMVAASETTLYQHPQAREAITKAMSRRIAENIENVSLMAPDEILDYQVENPYWHTLPYSEVLEKLEVDRLVLVDLVDYQTHEPGNAHVLRGLISANVGVLEADAMDADTFAFRQNVRAKYPRDAKVGLINSDEQTVELATVKHFTHKAAGLFYDHTELTAEAQ